MRFGNIFSKHSIEEKNSALSNSYPTGRPCINLYSLLTCFNALLKTIPVNIPLVINTNQSIPITIISKRSFLKSNKSELVELQETSRYNPWGIARECPNKDILNNQNN